MRLYYTDHFELPLPVGHRFPMSKYRLLRQRVATSDAHRRDVLLVPRAATLSELTLAHHPEYLERVSLGTLSAAEVRRIGFPWSPEMVERSRRSTGATLAAARAALADGCAANLAGGTHHAFADAGEGFCVLNDAAVAVRVLAGSGEIRRSAVIDCDVHQGNGTAAILAGDPSGVTFSIHGQKNFPLRKFPSDIDVPLEDGVDDAPYLDALERGLARLWAAGPFDLAIYLAGADPYEGDALGRLRLSKQGLRERDQVVLAACRKRGIPVAITMAGGYAPDVEDIVDIHAATLRIASQMADRPYAAATSRPRTSVNR